MYNPITASQLTLIGRTIKPHGINGEITLQNIADIDIDNLTCVFLNIDGIYVPFFINSVRQKSAETDLIRFDGIENEKDAAKLCQHDVFAYRSEASGLDENGNGFYASDLIGFSIRTSDNEVGKIIELDSTTENYLFVVESADGKRYLIPVADEFIIKIDETNRELTLDLPEGILEL